MEGNGGTYNPWATHGYIFYSYYLLSSQITLFISLYFHIIWYTDGIIFSSFFFRIINLKKGKVYLINDKIMFYRSMKTDFNSIIKNNCNYRVNILVMKMKMLRNLIKSWVLVAIQADHMSFLKTKLKAFLRYDEVFFLCFFLIII